MKDIFIVGGVSYNLMIYLDAFPAPIPQTIFSQGYHETIGSTGAGKALNLMNLGFNVTLQSLIGNDEFGKQLRSYLENTSIRYQPDIDPFGTERHVNLMDSEGRRISIFIAPVSQQPEINMGQFETTLEKTDLVVLNIQNYCRYLIPTIKHHGKKIWVDLHDYDGEDTYRQDFIDAADYIQMSSERLDDYHTIMRNLIEQGKEIVVCTHGKNGSSAVNQQGDWVYLPILSQYQLVDTNGAGDSFFSGFLYGMRQGYTLKKCMQMATISSGMCITTHELYHPGINPQLLEKAYKSYY